MLPSVTDDDRSLDALYLAGFSVCHICNSIVFLPLQIQERTGSIWVGMEQPGRDTKGVQADGLLERRGEHTLRCLPVSRLCCDTTAASLLAPPFLRLPVAVTSTLILSTDRY